MGTSSRPWVFRDVVRMDEKPCCAGDALRRIRRVDVGGLSVGISKLDEILADVKEMNLTGEKNIGKELLRRVKIYNYIPASVEKKYQTALLQEYMKSEKKGA
jgi:hypothetical protein